MFKTALKFIFVWAIRLLVTFILFFSIFTITSTNLIVGTVWATLIVAISLFSIFC